MPTNRPLIAATREPLNIQLNVKSGKLPSDWYGYVYINSPAGTVNSNGLPFPAGTQESGSPIMNGDGYIFRFDLGPGSLHMQTALMMPPCYYADLATKRGNTNNYEALYHFNNWGLTRMSMELGSRNALNTAITPFQFKEDATPRLLACYDAGRPWEFDPVSLLLKTPVGGNDEWTAATPPAAFPFPIVQGTAHPSFDPGTKELFLVNFTKSIDTIINNDEIVELVRKDIAMVEKTFENVLTNHLHIEKIEDLLAAIEKSIANTIDETEKKVLTWLKGLFHHHQKFQQQIATAQSESPAASPGSQDSVYLLRWDGSNGPMNKWQVLDEKGEPVKIIQCMHQTTLTKDYIILADATFKFSLDLLFNHPFSSEAINKFLRKFLTVAQLPYLDIYIIKRADLDPSKNSVRCKKLQQPIPLEAVHFSADYNNPDNQVTLHLAHNSAACLAEWVRVFDTLATQEGVAPDPEVIGLICVGDMDIGRIGKVVIDAEKAIITDQKYIIEKGNMADPQHIGVHTWGVGLYTYRDIISPVNAVGQLKYIFWSCYGLDPRLLTKFIFDLYKDYPNRIVDINTVLELSKKGVPFVLSRQNVATMQLEDFYQFNSNVILKSVQFVPLKTATPGRDSQLDGYIFTTVVVNYPNAGGNNYLCEIWIFRAWDLAAGPVCELNHPQLDYAFTLHSSWMDTAAPSVSTYNINIKNDYDPLIKKLEPAFRQTEIQQLFDKFVYPAFNKRES